MSKLKKSASIMDVYRFSVVCCRDGQTLLRDLTMCTGGGIWSLTPPGDSFVEHALLITSTRVNMVDIERMQVSLTAEGCSAHTKRWFVSKILFNGKEDFDRALAALVENHRQVWGELPSWWIGSQPTNERQHQRSGIV